MIELIVVPCDSGRRSYRMGRGPEVLMSSLAADIRPANITTVEVEGDPLDSAFAIAKQVSGAVRSALERDMLPVVLAGNCITSLGALAGFDAKPALLWLDAHADFNTPDTSPSGFLDGMALAVITGRCFGERSKEIPGFEPLPDAELVLLGTRSIDTGEMPIVERIARAHDSVQLRDALTRIERTDLYLHVDLDVLDPSSLRANQFATPNGLDTQSLLKCVSEAARLKRIVALAITAYDPAADTTQAAPHIVREIVKRVALRPA